MSRTYNTRITEMLGIQYPILCGGMQWVSTVDFVSHVCNAGGLGFITAETFETPEDLREQIKKMRDLTDKPFGINLSMVPEFGLPERTLKFCDVICEEEIKVVETAGRSPKPLMPVLKAGGVKVIHKLTNIRHAISAQKIGVDAVTILGFGSGGHVGMDDVSSFILLPMVVKELDVPVIAGGGVSNGSGLLGSLAMGAEAVLLGTAFFASKEAAVHDDIKQKLVDTKETGTTLVLRSVNNAMRVAKNRLADECLEKESQGATLEEIISTVGGGKGKAAYFSGDAESGPIPCGQIVGMIKEVKPVKQIIVDMIAEADILMERMHKVIT